MDKIIYIANSRIPTTKANGFQIMKMCEAFSGAGKNIELWIPRRINSVKENPFEYYGIRETFPIRKIFTIDLFFIEKLLGKFANLIESLFFSFFCLVRLSGALRENRDAIIYSRDQFILWFLSFTRVKFVYEEHVFPKHPEIYKMIWRRALGIVAITQGIKNLVSDEGIDREKIMVAPDAVDLESFNAVNQSKDDLRMELSLPRDNFLVGYVGKFKTLGMEKGIKTLVQSLTLIGKDVKIVFVGGEEKETREYRILAERFNVINHCLFFGYQSRERAIKFMKSMDVLVIPFPNHPHYALYASPLKLFEYMASGAPIIASDLPALKEILNTKSALFFKPDDFEDLARAVKMIKSSQALGYHLSQQASADVRNYTWKKRAESIIEFLEPRK